VKKLPSLSQHPRTGQWRYNRGGKTCYIPGVNLTREEAESILRSRIAGESIRTRAASENDKSTPISELAEYFFATAQSATVERGWKEKCRYVKDFVKKHEKDTISQIFPSDVTRWVSHERKWKPNTRRNAMKCVSAFFGWLLQEGVITKNPISGVKRPDEVYRDRQFAFPEDNFNNFCDVLKSRPLANIVPMLYYTGARPYEILQMEKTDYIREDRTVVYPPERTKNRKRRVIPLSPEAITLIEQALITTGGRYIFPGKTGKKIKTATLNKAFKRALTRAGLPKHLTPYSFRHGFAIRHLRKGTSPAIVSKWMGNNISTCMKYYSHIDEWIGSTVDML